MTTQQLQQWFNWFTSFLLPCLEFSLPFWNGLLSTTGRFPSIKDDTQSQVKKSDIAVPSVAALGYRWSCFFHLIKPKHIR
jgi:hypothetical protein